MNRPSYKELWSYEYKDRDEQLQWIRDAVDGNAKFRNSEPPYSEEEELAREIMQMHARIAELEAERLELRKTLGWAYDLDEYKDNPEVQKMYNKFNQNHRSKNERQILQER